MLIFWKIVFVRWQNKINFETYFLRSHVLIKKDLVIDSLRRGGL